MSDIDIAKGPKNAYNSLVAQGTIKEDAKQVRLYDIYLWILVFMHEVYY
jgi:hypothetical protein